MSSSAPPPRDEKSSVTQKFENIEEMLESTEENILNGAKQGVRDVISKVNSIQLPPIPDPTSTIKIDSKPLIVFSERLNSENKYFSSLIRSHPAFVASLISVFVVLPSALFGKRAIFKSVAYSFGGSYFTKMMFDWKYDLAKK